MFRYCKINNAGIPKYIKVVPPPTKFIARPLLKEIQDGSLLEKIQINNAFNSENNDNNNNNNNNNNNKSYAKLKSSSIGEKSKRKVIKIDSVKLLSTSSTETTFTKEFKKSKFQQTLILSLYPVKKLVFSAEDVLEIHKIETFLDSNELDNAIEYYHQSLLKEDSDINFRGFSMILYYLLNKISTTDLSGSNSSPLTAIEYFKYYINEHYIGWLESIDFIEFLRDCYEKSPDSVNQVYQILNQLNLLDIKRTFIFCIFYLQLNLQDKAIKIINDSFKLKELLGQQDSNISPSSTLKSKSDELLIIDYRFLNDYWDYNSNDNLLFKNKKVIKRDLQSLKYLDELESFNKLFSVSGKHLQFYSVIVQLFSNHGIITSKRLIPSFLQFINGCLESNEMELLEKVMAPYKVLLNSTLDSKEEGSLESNKYQIIALLYYYCYFNNQDSEKLVKIKNYLYDSIISNQIENNSISSYRFKVIFFDTLSLCSLETGDFGEAIYFSDLKRIILQRYNSELFNRSIGIKSDFYFPFIAFNEYHSKKEVLQRSSTFTEKINENKNSIKYWKDKNNESFIKFNNSNNSNSILNNSSDNYNNSNDNSISGNSGSIISASSFLYRPLNIQELVNESDKLIFNIVSRKPFKNMKDSNSIYYFKRLLELKNKYPNKQLDDFQFINSFKKYLLFLNNKIFSNNNSSISNNNSCRNNNNSINDNNCYNNIGISFNNNNSSNERFYKQLPHSNLFYSLIIRFKEYYENINKKQELLKFISTLSPQFRNQVFNINNEWYEYLYGKDYEGLEFMINTLDESIYRSNDFYNFWLYKFSSNCKIIGGNNLNQEYIDICWKLINKMVKENMKLYKKPLLVFSSFLFNSNITLTSQQIQLLNEIKLSNPWCEDSLDLLLIKLKFYPTNNFNQQSDNNINGNGNVSRDEIIKIRNQLKSNQIKTPDLVKLFINLSSLAYPINQDFSNFQEWNSISIHSNNCIKSFVQSVCTILKNENRISELLIYINSERKVIGTMDFNTIIDILSPLSPVGQASFIQNNLRLSNSYSKDFVNYIKHLNQLLPQENKYEFSILPSIISKEREISENEINNKLLKQSKFINLFKSIYLN